MEQLKNTTELIGLKDKNIKIKTVFKADTHITIEASLDYQPPL
ncbi:ISL3 family transposase, partial [Streptococcus sp. HF-1907]|nr:ISL3 family transposase [Streptococcus sp. HF-1907]